MKHEIPNILAISSTNRQLQQALQYTSERSDCQYLCIGCPTIDSAAARNAPSSVTISSAGEPQSSASTSTTLFYMTRCSAPGLFGDSTAFTRCRVASKCRACDPEESWRSTAKSVTIEYRGQRTAEWEAVSDEEQRRGLKASKSESYIIRSARPSTDGRLGQRWHTGVGHGLEEYSLGSGNPYGWSEPL
jgi:hypothetical protein